MQLKRKKNYIKIFIGGMIIGSGIVILNKPANKEILIKDNISINNTLALYKSDDSINYAKIEEMPESGYIINEEKSYCTLDNKTHDSEAILKTIDGNHTIAGLKRSSKCYIWFDKKELTASETILANIIPKDTTPDFSVIATTDEGVFKAEDGMYGGYSYYWRGAVTNNYVKFAGFCWRIIRINGDGSLRLLYDGNSCHNNGTSTAESIAVANVAYNTIYNQSNYVGWTYTGTSQRTLSGTASNAKTQLESWYTSNLSSYAERIADGKYCNDRNVVSGFTWAINGNAFDYAGYKRLYTDYAPTLGCNSGDMYTLKVGLITADEVEFAGGKNANNTAYYLYNGQNYWTMSPSNWNGTGAVVFYVNGNCHLTLNYVNYTYGVRPVINLKSDIEFVSGGNGTQNNPYVVQ